MPLPIAGLMSARPAAEVSRDYAGICRVAKGLGSRIEDPFLALSFLGYP